MSALIIAAQSAWNHDAFFDKFDRGMGVQQPSPVEGGGSAEAQVINHLWTAYRACSWALVELLHPLLFDKFPTMWLE